MLRKSKGIVLRKHSYSDTSYIVRILTETFGMQSFLIPGVRSKKAKTKANLFQSFSLLDLVYYHKEKSTLQRTKEVRSSQFLRTIHYDVFKSAITLFLAELTYKCIPENEPNPDLFAFVYHAIHILDETDQDYTNFHLIYMVKLARYLGFYPQNEPLNTDQYFDLREGSFVPSRPDHQDFVVPEHAVLLSQLFNTSFGEMGSINLNNTTRKQLLSQLIAFYEIHVENLGSLKSFSVLQDTLHN